MDFPEPSDSARDGLPSGEPTAPGGDCSSDLPGWSHAPSRLGLTQGDQPALREVENEPTPANLAVAPAARAPKSSKRTQPSRRKPRKCEIEATIIGVGARAR